DPATKDAYPYTVGAAIAEVDGSYFATFGEAVAAAGGSKTITLLGNIDDPYTLAVDEMLIVKQGDFTLTVNAPEGDYVVSSSTTDGVTTYSVAAAVAKIGDTLFASLEGAVATAQDDAIIELIAEA